MQGNFDALAQTTDPSSFSSFLRLLAAGDRKINFGTVGLTFTAATTVSLTQAHNLGVVPATVVATPGSSDVRADVSGLGTTNFTFRLTSNIGALTGNYAGYWIAIG